MASGPDLLEQNIGSIFDVLDTDHDGYMTEDDLPASGRKVMDEFAITDATGRAEVEGAYSAWWTRLREDCDSDGDGRITRQEFIAAHATGRGDPRGYVQQLVGPVVDAIARVVDQDGDGFIQAADYARTFASNGIDAKVASAGFERLDADADGKITTGEFADAVMHLLSSQDPADSGTAILGRT